MATKFAHDLLPPDAVRRVLGIAGVDAGIDLPQDRYLGLEEVRELIFEARGGQPFSHSEFEAIQRQLSQGELVDPHFAVAAIPHEPAPGEGQLPWELASHEADSCPMCPTQDNPSLTGSL